MDGTRHTCVAVKAAALICAEDQIHALAVPIRLIEHGFVVRLRSPRTVLDRIVQVLSPQTLQDEEALSEGRITEQ